MNYNKKKPAHRAGYKLVCNNAGDKSVEAWGLGPDRLQPLSGQELQDQPGSKLIQTGSLESDFC
jgi:hypothetical protein